MLLNHEQSARFQEHLTRAEVPDACRVCQAPFPLARGAELVGALMYTNLLDGSTPVRTVRCVCPRCAAILDFDAEAIGIRLPDR